MTAIHLVNRSTAFSCLPRVNVKWTLIAASVGILAGAAICLYSLRYQVNSTEYISCLSVGSSLAVLSISSILLAFLSLKRREYRPITFQKTQAGSKEIPNVPFNEISSISLKIKNGKHLSTPMSLIRLTTANLGMLPPAANAFQQISHFFYPQECLLAPAHQRVSKIADKLEGDIGQGAIFCFQEVFDQKAAEILARRLESRGFTVVNDIHDGTSLVNSGLLFASSFPIDKEKIRFWKFTNLTHSDAFSSKGLLRIPLQISLSDTKIQNVIIYTTHLQAQLSEKKARREQLAGILSIIQQDQSEDPERMIFLAGDFNITDKEHDGTQQNEYSENSSFFSQFYDFVQNAYENNVIQGTFYKLKKSKESEVAQDCLYDRILLYTGGTKQFDTCHPISTETHTFFSNQLSDHLPVTLTFSF